MSGEFRQCHTFYMENVGENVGGILRMLVDWVRLYKRSLN